MIRSTTDSKQASLSSLSAIIKSFRAYAKLQKVQSYAFISLSILVVIAVLSFINFSAYSKNSERTITDEILNNKQPVSCCGGQTAEVNETYKLLGSYYSLKDGQNVVLMFNNKGNAPLPVNPIIYNLNGERLDLPSLTIQAAGYQEYNLQELLINHLPQFEEGSLQITHQERSYNSECR